jgi:formate hydrogenlyase subunit 3/multisubunit Na+/H+ antiporter MnhD subunit
VSWTFPLLATPVVVAMGRPCPGPGSGFVRAREPRGPGGQVLALLGCALGLLPGLAVLFGAPAVDYSAPWSVPFGAIHVHLDALAALFLVFVFVLSAVLVVVTARTLGVASQGWLNLLIASLALVVARTSSCSSSPGRSWRSPRTC